MTIPDLPDWAQGVGVIDQAINLNPVGVTTITPGGADVTVDTSRVASVDVGLTMAIGAAGLQRYLLIADWIEGTQNVGRQTVTFHNSVQYAGTNGFNWQLPALGAQLQLTLIGTDATACNLSIVGSTRQVPGPRFERSGPIIGNLLLDSGTVNIGAGANATFEVPPVERAVAFNAGWSMTSGTCEVRGVYDDKTVGMTTGRIYLGSITGIGLSVNDFPAPLIALEFTVHNGDAGAHSGVLSVWDVS